MKTKKHIFVIVKRLLVLLSFIICSHLSFGQNEFTFKGVILDADSKMPVPYATIQVLNKKQGVASDQVGKFNIKVSIKDQIQVSSVGYHPHIFVVTKAHQNEDQEIPIYLLPKTYELDSVEVIQMRDNFYLKKPKWDTLKIDNPYLTSDPINWDNVNTISNTNGLAGFSITGFLNGFDKDLQQKKKLERLRNAERFKQERKALIEQKFNKKVVKEITDIDDRVLDEFMNFCDFRDGEILRASNYEMTVMILNKYKLFLKR